MINIDFPMALDLSLSWQTQQISILVTAAFFFQKNAPLQSFPRAAAVLAWENGTFFEFSLCLSRACLGKIMHFIYKWLKK
jgi:hypothetical protein